jgi:hypothetical protein
LVVILLKLAFAATFFFFLIRTFDKSYIGVIP